MSAPGDAQPLLCQHDADCVAARRMTGNDDRQQAGMVRGEIAMYPRGDLLLAGMRAGSQPQRTRTDLVAQVRQFGAVERQCGSGGLEIAEGGHLPGAQRAKSLGLPLVLGEAQVERSQYGSDQPRPASPAAVRTRRKPGIEEHHRNVPGIRRKDQIGPQLGFDPKCQVGTPMVEKARSPTRQVGGNELVARACRQPGLQQARRGDRAGRDQNFEVRTSVQQMFDQPQYCGRFTDAGGMYPDQGTLRPGRAGNASALAKADRVFLAALAPLRQIQHCHRRQRPGHGAIKPRQHQPPAMRRAGSMASVAAAPVPRARHGARPHRPSRPFWSRQGVGRIRPRLGRLPRQNVIGLPHR